LAGRKATLTMCSGCSGAFDGDGEDQELGYRLPFEDESGVAEGVARAAESAERAAPEILPGCSMGMAEDYEVLVSAERIIERRTIRAKCHNFSKKEMPDGGEAWQGSPQGYKQPKPETAKCYRTQSDFDFDRRHARSNGGMWLIGLYLGCLAAFAVVLWLALGSSM
jgi:hypothetical protein